MYDFKLFGSYPVTMNMRGISKKNFHGFHEKVCLSVSKFSNRIIISKLSNDDQKLVFSI